MVGAAIDRHARSQRRLQPRCEIAALWQQQRNVKESRAIGRGLDTRLHHETDQNTSVNTKIGSVWTLCKHLQSNRSGPIVKRTLEIRHGQLHPAEHRACG